MSSFICESQTRKSLTLLLQYALSSSSNNNNYNPPWLHLQRPPLLPDFSPSSSAPAILPPRRFLSSLIPQDIWSGRSFSLKGLYSNTWPDVSISNKDSFFSRQKGVAGGSSVSRSDSQMSWTNILIASKFLTYGAQIATRGRLMSWGALIDYRVAEGQLYRLVTAAFLHSSVPHLLINCFGLYSFGNHVESNFGPVRFLALYFTSAVASSAMSYRLGGGCSVGCSGIICGLIGAHAVYLMRHKDLLEDEATKGLQNIAIIVALNMLIGSRNKSIDHWAHLGGLLGGAAASLIFGPSLK